MGLLKFFVPANYYTSVDLIRPEDLLKKGIKGVLTDLDNTLVCWNDPETNQKVIDWFKRMHDAGIKTVIISNNSEKRVHEFAEPMAVDYVHKARKPLASGFKKGISKMQLQNDQVAIIGDQLLTDVLGGNLLGIHTILVDPLDSKEFAVTKFNRNIEKKIIKYLFRKGIISWTR